MGQRKEAIRYRGARFAKYEARRVCTVYPPVCSTVQHNYSVVRVRYAVLYSCTDWQKRQSTNRVTGPICVVGKYSTGTLYCTYGTVYEYCTKYTYNTVVALYSTVSKTKCWTAELMMQRNKAPGRCTCNLRVMPLRRLRDETYGTYSVISLLISEMDLFCA